MNNEYNVLIDLVGFFLIGAIIIVAREQRKRGDSFNNKLVHYLMLCCSLVFLMDIPGLLLDGSTFPGARLLLWIVDTAYWICQIVYCWLWLLFADYWSFGSKKHMKRLAPAYAIPMIIEILLILATPFNGWVFTIGEDNVYVRGSFYLLNMLPYVVYIVGACAVTVNGYRTSTDPERKRRKLSLIVYMFLPVCGVFFDAFIYGVSWVWPMVALSLLMVYLNVQQQYISDEQITAANMKQEMADNRIAITLSQIQPHFLYNSLTSIYGLCDTNPHKAQEAVGLFSNYLRFNMDSLKQNKPVPFSTEKSHVEIYLTLEKIRYDDKLNVVWDIQTESFMIPSLTVQPLVENSVKYGLGKSPEGGTVTVSTREDDSGYIVTVADDGVGFDPMQVQEDGRTHIGIDNVRARLASICGGTLEITSEIGKGTAAIIRIPKEAQA